MSESAAIPAPIPAPIIVTALFGKADAVWFDGLRRAHFPPERNRLDAHLTMFHHLAPSLETHMYARGAVISGVSWVAVGLTGARTRAYLFGACSNGLVAELRRA